MSAHIAYIVRSREVFEVYSLMFSMIFKCAMLTQSKFIKLQTLSHQFFCLLTATDPQDVIRCNDTIIGDPLYEVPVTVDGEGDKVSLCFEVQGRADQHFNLISDTCVSVNALYVPMINGAQGNVINTIGVLAEDNNGTCQEIEVDWTGCTVRVNGRVIPAMYNMDGIHNEQPMIKFVTVRGFNLRPTSHGLIGKR